MLNKDGKEVTNISCKWVKADGAQCSDTRLVPDASYCYRHYWQALWAQHERANTPVPIEVDWKAVLIFVVIALILLLTWVTSPNWIFLTWIYRLKLYLSGMSYTGNFGYDLWSLIGWFAVGANICVMFWLSMLIGCVYPLRPKTRRTQILAGLILYATFVLTIGVSSLATLGSGPAIRPQWISAFILDVGILQVMFLVFYSADKLNPRIIIRFGFISVATIFFLAFVGNFAAFLVTSDADTVALVRRLGISLLGLLSGFAVMSTRGRSFVTEVLTDRVSVLADALWPADAYSLGFSRPTVTARRQALAKALEMFSNLTPLEQQELEEFVSVKRRPSVFQKLIGIGLILLSAFLLEAPAQMLFAWVACHLLNLGAPLCVN